MYPRGRTDPDQTTSPPRYPGSFLLAVREALAEMQWEARRWLGMAVECVDAAGRDQVLGLENLYRRLRREDRETWPALILEVLRSVPAEPLEQVKLHDVAERILLRLGPPFSPGSEGKEIWFEPLVGKRLGLTLVIDHPNSMAYVTTEQIAESQETAAAWVERAIANLSSKTPVNCVREVHPASGLRQCEVGDAYDSSRAMLLDTMLPGHDENGFFVVVPGRDHLLVMPVVKEALEHLAWLRALAARTHKTVPYPISGEVFWVRRGAWHHFAIQAHQKQVVMSPPPEFVEVLLRLAPDLSIDMSIETEDDDDALSN